MTNETQREYWNAGPGQRWASLQQAFDRSFEELSEALFAAAALRAGERILDVGCGSGATTLEAARRTGSSGSVLGVDVSEPLLALARERAAGEGLRNVAFVLADAQTEPFSRGAYDLLVSRLGVMFFDDPVAAFCNLRQALRPAGRLCFVCWAPLSLNPWFALPLAAGVRLLGEPDPQPPRAPGPMAFSDKDYVRHILVRAGFGRIEVAEARLTLRGHATVEEEATFALAAGPLVRLLTAKNAGRQARERIAGDVAAAFAPFLTDHGVRTPGAFHLVTAQNVKEV